MPLLGSLEQWTLLRKESLRFQDAATETTKAEKQKENEGKGHTPEYPRTVP